MLRRTAIRRALERLRSQVGESIAEVLVALLISAVGVAMLVGMIGVSTRIIDKSTEKMREEYNKTAVTPADSTGTATLSGDGSVSQPFTIKDQLHDPDGSGSAQPEVIFYTPAQAASSSTSVSGAG